MNTIEDKNQCEYNQFFSKTGIEMTDNGYPSMHR